ncbi:MAG TPA: hypothetical protein VJ608_10625, partial [Albitalea sp.]|nr:hypothetical protein [Albitalea sp.]
AYEGAYAAWVDEVARYIAQAWASGAEGMLVLMTRYADLAALRAQLSAVVPTCHRSVRCSGTPGNRRLHFPEAGQHLPTMAGLFAPIRRWFARYHRQIAV